MTPEQEVENTLDTTRVCWATKPAAGIFRRPAFCDGKGLPNFNRYGRERIAVHNEALVTCVACLSLRNSWFSLEGK